MFHMRSDRNAVVQRPKAPSNQTLTLPLVRLLPNTELLDGEIFYGLREAQVVIESWRRHYNTVRPHASLGYRPPAPEVLIPALAARPAAPVRPAPPARLPMAPRPRLH